MNEGIQEVHERREPAPEQWGGLSAAVRMLDQPGMLPWSRKAQAEKDVLQGKVGTRPSLRTKAGAGRARPSYARFFQGFKSSDVESPPRALRPKALADLDDLRLMS